MNLLGYLKETRKQLTPIVEKPKEPTIEIVIENDTDFYENEKEVILNGGKGFFEHGNAASLEEGIITFATMIRGLKYQRTEKDDQGNIKVILKNMAIDYSLSKAL